MSEQPIIRKIAVLGAGVMGAQIAAHCANADIPVLLFDLANADGDPGAIVKKAIAGLKKLEPSPLATQGITAHIEACNYDHDLARLGQCDLVIEAVAERADIKAALYARIAPHLAPAAIFASNTSGLSINALAASLPAHLRPRFCGVHFFNPPRYMPLVELIPSRDTDPQLADTLETFLTTAMGKSVVRALDTPNFVANRVGVFSMLAAIHHTERLKLGFDVVDALTGPAIGRPKSATYRTADVVGLDTMAHVIKTLQDSLPADPWAAFYRVPEWLSALISQGALGQKSGVGIYRKEGKTIRVMELATGTYRDSTSDIDPDVAAILKLKNPADKFTQLRQHQSPQAQFLWAIFRDVFHYCAVHLKDIAHSARDIDCAMRWGFGWAQGPFETWSAGGWQTIAQAIAEDIKAGKTMAQASLPDWVFDGRVGVHHPEGSWSAASNTNYPRSGLAVYCRQYVPDRLLGEGKADGEAPGITLMENEAIRLWHTADDPDKDVAILSFKSKLSTIGPDVIEGIMASVDRAEQHHRALVIWQPRGPFCAGANLKALQPLLAAGDYAALDAVIADFQRMSQRLKYAQVPVVAAVSGLALGGGCEVLMHCARTVAALESYIGLVEPGVGLIPAGGGCKEFAVRASSAAARTANNDPFAFIAPVFQTIAMATASKSARHAGELGFLRDADRVVMNPHELLFVAKRCALALADAAYRAPLPPRDITVCGRDGIATLEMMLINMREGGMISDHDYRVSRAVATALCGGEVDTGTRVDEAWLLSVERALFVELLKTEKTQARIQHTLDTGKPLRN